MPVPTNGASMSSEKTVQESSSEQDESLGRPQQIAEQKESMILVQVNSGETFTIQAENHTQCITGPAQVPMVSPNGAIPPIQVPNGYISHVIEDHHGFRKVVVIPEAQSDRFLDRSITQPMVSQSGHRMQHPIRLQPRTHYNYMQQMNAMPINQQLFPAENCMHMLQQPIYTQTEGLASTDIEQHNIQFMSQSFHHQLQRMDPDHGHSTGNGKENLQRRLREWRHQYIPDPSPSSTHSISPSSSLSYVASPSPNSSPDSSPNMRNCSISGDEDALPVKAHHYHRTLHFPSGQHDHQLRYAFLSNVHGNDGCNTPKSNLQNFSKTTTSDGMSSDSITEDSPRQVTSTSHQQTKLQRDVTKPCLDLPQQADEKSGDIYLPYPTNDGNWDLKDFLSSLSKPEIFDIAPRHACIKWSLRYSPPSNSTLKMQAISFEVHLMRKEKDCNKFRVVNRDYSNCVEIKDLKPGAEYHAKVLAECDNVKGACSEVVTFHTKSCPPDTPGAPKIIGNTKNSINLKWMAPNDNGKKIIKYHLEWDEGEKGSGFRSLFSDSQKQHKVTKLLPMRYYTFRLKCENEMGISPWSPEVTYRTSGMAPAIPDPPRLSKAFVQSLTVVWSCSPTSSNDSNSGYDTRFTLEMDDGAGYGFIAVYDGSDLRTLIKNLNKSSLYKFRLRAYNNEGKSGYSTTVSFYTLPDKPSPPGKVVLKGRPHPTWFKVTWDPPSENGGSAVTKYILECAKEKSQQMEQIYTGLDTEVLLEEVQPGATCRLRVCCVTNGGTSLPSEVTFISVPPVVPGQCAPPWADAKTGPTVISIRWDPPNYDGGSSITQYEVAMCSTSSEEVINPKESLNQVYLGTALDHTFGNCKPGTAYQFIIRAANKVGMGQWSDVVELSTCAGAPEKPDAPESEIVTSDSALLSWKKPHDNGSEITGYFMEWGSEDSAMTVQRMSSILSCSFTRLMPNRTYFFRVQAMNKSGKGPYSDVATLKTAPSCPGQIAKIWQGDFLPIEEYVERDDVDEATFPRPATSAMVCWDRPPDNGSEITHFVLEVVLIKSERKKAAATSDERYFEIDRHYCCHLVQNMQPDSTHRMRVRAVNGIGSGRFSYPLSITTQPLPPDPPLLECASSHNSLKLKWGDMDSTSSCTLQMREKHGRYATIYSGLGRTYKVSRCTERTTYHFRINAKNDAGEGPFSDVYNFTTTIAPPPQLKSLPHVAVHGNCADISWEAGESIKGDGVSYILNIEPCRNFIAKQTISLRHNSYRLNDLSPGSRYKVQVALVRHLTSHSLSLMTMQDSATQLKDGYSENQLTVIADHHEIKAEEDVTGSFTNWVTFEAPLPDSAHDGEVENSTVLAASTHTPRSLPGMWTRMIDDTMGPVLLTIVFFLLAIVVAFTMQFVVV